MNDELAARYAEDLRQTIGHPARMISFSKSEYCDRHPDHVAIFNANVCIAAGKLWWGDLDLTLDEPKLAELARRIDATVFVLHEADARFSNEGKPLLEQAVYSVTPSGHSRFRWKYIERAGDGTLRVRPPEPERLRRLALTLGWPRLLRFWRIELLRSQVPSAQGRRPGRSGLLYIGARDGGQTPLLVLGLDLPEGSERYFRCEWTWYPTRKRHAPRPLIDLYLSRRRGRLRPFVRLVVHPGFTYSFVFGITVGGGPRY